MLTSLSIEELLTKIPEILTKIVKVIRMMDIFEIGKKYLNKPNEQFVTVRAGWLAGWLDIKAVLSIAYSDLQFFPFALGIKQRKAFQVIRCLA